MIVDPRPLAGDPVRRVVRIEVMRVGAQLVRIEHLSCKHAVHVSGPSTARFRSCRECGRRAEGARPS